MLTLLIVAVVLTLGHAFLNGFHDVGQTLATTISTGVMRPRRAVVVMAVMHLLGGLLGTAVAATLVTMVGPLSLHALIAALLAANIWNLFAWALRLPGSSTHALVGGLIAVGGAGEGRQATLVGLLILPFLVGLLALGLTLVLYHLVRRQRVVQVNERFGFYQAISTLILGLGQGHNDAQKALAAFLLLGTAVPEGWARLLCAGALASGTLVGGLQRLQTRGFRRLKLRPLHGVVVEVVAGTALHLASWFGLPVSTIHLVQAGVLGTGATTRLSTYAWGLSGRVLWTWLLTPLVCGALAAGIYVVVGR